MANMHIFKHPDRIAENVQVFCRVRPLKSSVENAENKIVLHLKQDYVFNQLFDETATQADVFDNVARPLVERLVRGSNSLLFTYGVTGSGKTYTMAGVANNCGILPRCLKTLFKTIENYHAPKNTFQSDHLNGFELATETENKPLMYGDTLKTARTPNLRRKNSDLDFNLESIGETLAVSGINKRNIYAVFVSYVEIYNNSVYDLLEGLSQKPLQSHIVREDANHNMYVHGAVELQINSVQEAIEVFHIGQKRKRMGQTALNEESSRSHSVFNIRLVQAPRSKNTAIVENFITISQLSLVDLAGSERSSRTNNTGARLRETGKINNSLMKLRECFEYLRENQQAVNGAGTKKIPYRDSKLTYMFKNFFEGNGLVSMIVCINPDANDNAENLKVLKFAEEAQKVQLMNAKPTAISTPLKRQAWSRENTCLVTETKIKPISAIKKPIQQKFQTDNSAHQLDLNEKKIMLLERQNLELRLELARVREAFEKELGRPWCDITKNKIEIYATARKPLIGRQKSTVCQSNSQSKPFVRGITNVGESLHLKNTSKSDFQNEFKQTLQKQREKLEASLEAAKHKTENQTIQHCPSDNKTDYTNESNKSYKNTENQKDLHSNNSRLAAINNPDESYRTPCSKKLKFDDCFEMDVFASFRMTAHKRLQFNKQLDEDSSNTRRKHNYFNENITPQSCKSLKNCIIQKDVDFDKREHELSLKMEKHRRSQKGNKYLLDILWSSRHSKSSTDLSQRPMPKRHPFSTQKQHYYTDEELI